MARRAAGAEASAIRQAIREVASDVRSLPLRAPETPGREMVLHEAALIARGRKPQALAAAGRASEAAGGLLMLEPSGPLASVPLLPGAERDPDVTGGRLAHAIARGRGLDAPSFEGLSRFEAEGLAILHGPLPGGSPMTDLAHVEAYAAAVDQIHRQETILPLRYGCVVASEEGLGDLILRHREAWLLALDEVEACDGWAFGSCSTFRRHGAPTLRNPNTTPFRVAQVQPILPRSGPGSKGKAPVSRGDPGCGRDPRGTGGAQPTICRRAARPRSRAVALALLPRPSIGSRGLLPCRPGPGGPGARQASPDRSLAAVQLRRPRPG